VPEAFLMTQHIPVSLLRPAPPILLIPQIQCAQGPSVCTTTRRQSGRHLRRWFMHEMLMEMQLQMLIAATVKDSSSVLRHRSTSSSSSASKKASRRTRRTAGAWEDRRQFITIAFANQRGDKRRRACAAQKIQIGSEEGLTQLVVVDGRWPMALSPCLIHMQIRPRWWPQMKCQHAEMQREHRIANYGDASSLTKLRLNNSTALLEATT